MSAREMWAPTEWKEWKNPPLYNDPRQASADPQLTFPRNVVRVLVQEIPSDMPEFEVDDVVELTGGYRDIVDARPFRDKNGEWRIPLFHSAKTVRPNQVTKVPSETSRLIRVTGPEHEVEEGIRWHKGRDSRVRVEVVDD